MMFWDFPVISYFPRILSLKWLGNCEATRINHVYYYSNHPSFHLWWEKNSVKSQKVSKCYGHYCLKFFFWLFMPLLISGIVINDHTLAGICFIFLKCLLDQSWKAFNIKFAYQCKDLNRSYQVRQNLVLF